LEFSKVGKSGHLPKRGNSKRIHKIRTEIGRTRRQNYQLDLSLDFRTAGELEEMSEQHSTVSQKVGKLDFPTVFLSVVTLEQESARKSELLWENWLV
jgi:hypothetical protein